MTLTILLPTELFLQQDVSKVTAFAPNGSFCLLERHIDFVTVLVPGILSYETAEGREEFIAVDEGTLVKCGTEVRISTRNALGGVPIGELKDRIENEFRALDERERKTRTALAKLEVDFLRRFMELGK